MTVKNQKEADEKCKYFPIILIFKIKLQLIAISTCCKKSDSFSHDELRAISSAQIAVLQVGFTLVITLKNLDFESHWNTLIFFDKKN